MVTTANGAYVIAGTVSSINAVCGTTTANVTVSYSTSNGYSYTQGAVIGTAAAAVGTTFNIGVPTYTNYCLSATAGQCSVTRCDVPALTNGNQAYNITLGGSSNCSFGYCYKATSRDSGTLSVAYAGNGDLEIDPAQIFFSSNKVTPFDLTLSFSSGNDLLSSVPAEAQGWDGSVAADGSLKVNGASLDHLSYAAQVDASLLQYNQGFCGSKGDALNKAATYLQQSGFADKSIQAFKTSWSQASIAENICLYPQDTATLDRAVSYKTNSKITANRVWFIIVSNNLQANNKKLSEKLAKLLPTQPKSDALLALKKHPVDRKIASDSDIIADEWALGFVIQK
jgi:hypothetical protein